MIISKIIIKKVFNEEPVKAAVTIVINNFHHCFDIQIIEGVKRDFVAISNIKEEEMIFSKFINPIYPEARHEFEQCILDAYYKFCAKDGKYSNISEQRTKYEIANVKQNEYLNISEIKVKHVEDKGDLKSVLKFMM